MRQDFDFRRRLRRRRKEANTSSPASTAVRAAIKLGIFLMSSGEEGEGEEGEEEEVGPRLPTPRRKKRLACIARRSAPWVPSR